MKSKIEMLIKNFVKHYPDTNDVQTKWKEPLISYADAEDEMFLTLKEVVGSFHTMPQDLLPEAKTVIAYFIPFDDGLIRSNVEGKESSKIWAIAYIETNQLISDLNNFMKDELDKLGYKSNVITATHNFNNIDLISNWSHRHVAFIAGLGKFGLNNMLITESGCCGRIGTFVTELIIEPTRRKSEEYCLYKQRKTCTKCVDRCVNNALKVDYFDRHKCYEMCMYNDKIHSDIDLSDVCGKCLVNVPCSTTNPVKFKK